MIDTRPAKRYRASQSEWRAIRMEFNYENCWCCGDPWSELHHILNRSHSGDDVTVNLAPLCAECHRRVEARDAVSRSLIRQALLPSNIGYLRWKMGEQVEGWLDRNYPLALPNTHAKEQVLDLGLDLAVAVNEVLK